MYSKDVTYELIVSSNIREAHKMMIDAAGTGAGTFVISGRQGSGKSLLARSMVVGLRNKGILPYHTRVYHGTQSTGYREFVDLLAQAGKRDKISGPDEILEAFHQVIHNAYPSGIAFILESLDRCGDQSRDLFIRLSQMELRGSYLLLATILNSAGGWAEYELFRVMVENDAKIVLVELKESTLDDVVFLAEKLGYKLPEDFIKNVYEMCSGNLWYIAHAIEYYHRIGIINADMEIDWAMYRYLPIPPSIEDNYWGVYKSLTREEQLVLDCLMLESGSMDGQEFDTLLPENEYHTSKVVSALRNNSIIHATKERIGFFSVSFYQYYSNQRNGKVPERVLLAVRYRNTFGTLPLHLRLLSMLLNGESGEVLSIIRDMGVSIVKSFHSLGQLDRFIELAKSKIPESDLGHQMELIRGAHLYYLGYTADAAKGLEGLVFEEKERIQQNVLLGLIYNIQGEYAKSEACAQTVLSTPGIGERSRCDATAIMSEVCLNTGRTDESMELAQNLLTQSEKNGYYDLIGKALTLIGNNYTSQGKLDEAMKSYDRSIEVSERNELKTQLMFNLINKGSIYSGRGENDKEISGYLEALRISYSISEVAVRSFALSSLIDVYYNLGKIREAAAYLQVESELVETTGNANMQFWQNRNTMMFGLMDLKLSELAPVAEQAIEITNKLDYEEGREMFRAMTASLNIFLEDDHSISDLNLFVKRYEPSDSFLPYFYVLGSVTFLANGKFTKGMQSVDRLIEACSSNSEDRFYRSWGKAALIMRLAFTLDSEKLLPAINSFEEKSSEFPFVDSIIKSGRLVFQHTSSADVAQLLLLKLDSDYVNSLPTLLYGLIRIIQARMLQASFHLDPLESCKKLGLENNKLFAKVLASLQANDSKATKPR